ncbi:MAG: ABC transporter permease subunit [Desulfitobacteriaceae bacterium]|nr:ABC transporter permease subunit [Desulfitobacteriaceae bacterium]MDD4753728.1 ABC transporter permease subunit [Desulfitobacteriaceae bacterium]
MIEFRIPLGDVTNDIFDRLITVIAPVTNALSSSLETFLRWNETFLLLWPPLLFIVVLGLVVWFFVDKKLSIFIAFSLIFMFGLALWDQTMSTLGLVIAGTLLSLLFGIPIGILASQYDMAEKVITPILDFMQTLPSFVYLIPAVIFFGLGKVAALAAILIFALPPAVRLTNLGIRQVPTEMIEAASAFGSTRTQILKEVQLPLAMPTIMTGVNQCIMMSLSMSVIAAMIGAGGLGREVLRAMQTVDIGLGMEGGLGIVVVAIILDRISQRIAKRSKEERDISK